MNKLFVVDTNRSLRMARGGVFGPGVPPLAATLIRLMDQHLMT